VILSDDRVSGDDLTASYTVASFADANVGNGKTVSVSGILVTGTDADNYTVNTTAIATADITPATLTGSVTADNKIYDGTTAATLATGALSGVVGSEDVSLSGGTATFDDKNTGTGKTVTATGLSLSGADASNYQLASTSAATTADITAATLTGSITANNKTYDSTTPATIATRNLSGVVGGDAVSLVDGTASFADKNVDSGKTVAATGLSLSGADASNYQLASTSAATTADITARTLTVSATGVNKVYDGTTTATVTLSDNRVSGDNLTASHTTAEFADKNVSTGKTFSVNGISVTGTDAGNYTVNTTATTAADITARTLTVSAVGVNKVYDGTAAATVTLLDDRIEGDVLTASYTTASFDDKNVQNGKQVSVSGISVTGTDAGNYTVNTEASTVADITGATLTVVGIVAENKVYDGTTVATLILDGATGIGVVSGDDVTVNADGVAGAFSDAEVGTNKLVTVSGLTLIGADAAHYTLTQPTTTADITPAP
jgi:phage-related protein